MSKEGAWSLTRHGRYRITEELARKRTELAEQASHETILPRMSTIWRRFKMSDDWVALETTIASCAQERTRQACK